LIFFENLEFYEILEKFRNFDIENFTFFIL
jgi:hypothetical protein